MSNFLNTFSHAENSIVKTKMCSVCVKRSRAFSTLFFRHFLLQLNFVSVPNRLCASQCMYTHQHLDLFDSLLFCHYDFMNIVTAL